MTSSAEQSLASSGWTSDYIRVYVSHRPITVEDAAKFGDLPWADQTAMDIFAKWGFAPVNGRALLRSDQAYRGFAANSGSIVLVGYSGEALGSQIFLYATMLDNSHVRGDSLGVKWPVYFYYLGQFRHPVDGTVWRMFSPISGNNQFGADTDLRGGFWFHRD
jgi:hypothetical protein